MTIVWNNYPVKDVVIHMINGESHDLAMNSSAYSKVMVERADNGNGDVHVRYFSNMGQLSDVEVLEKIFTASVVATLIITYSR